MLSADIINIALAFLEGIALIASPCILPILPIILSGSLTGSKARPYGIITGFVIAFTLVTLFSRTFIELTHLSQDSIRYVSFGLLFILGCCMVSTTLTAIFNRFTQQLQQVGSHLSLANDAKSGFWGGLLFGSLIGIIWTPCAGPILAAVIVQVILQQSTFSSIAVVLAFSIGVVVPMLAIVLLGRECLQHLGGLRAHTVMLRQLLGAIIIVSVIYLVYTTGGALSYLTTTRERTSFNANALVEGVTYPYPAPAIASVAAWINSSPLDLAALKGKVILIDFWTYSCINCLRTLPYLKDWYARYHDQGFVIIGIHSPEFLFEQDFTNVSHAVKKLGIDYPVALDNQFATWRNYHNRYWPAHFLIDKQGYVVYQHAGEGHYDITENNIRYLLGLKEKQPANKPSKAGFSYTQTPETYLGYARLSHVANQDSIKQNVSALYRFPPLLRQREWALAGEWLVAADKVVAKSNNAALRLHFNAAKVFAVMGTHLQPVKVRILINGKYQRTLTIKSHQLYTLLQQEKEQEAILELIPTEPGLEIYTFTFGN